MCNPGAAEGMACFSASYRLTSPLERTGILTEAKHKPAEGAGVPLHVSLRLQSHARLPDNTSTYICSESGR